MFRKYIRKDGKLKVFRGATVSKKRARDNNKVEYWQSYADVMSVLVLMLILVIVAILILLLGIDDIGEGDAQVTAEVAYDKDENKGLGSNEAKPSGEYAIKEQSTGGDGGGSGSGKSNNTGKGMYQEPPTEYTGIGSDRAAVQVIVVDGETKQVIKNSGSQFQLYEKGGALKTLSTYYPEKVTYDVFATTETGTFYLPEKILLGSYFLHQITAPEGYDVGKDVYFQIKKAQEWETPYAIHFPIYPSKNIIKLYIKDKDTEQGISTGSYQIIADKNIITLDGTIRNKAGEVVDTIKCDKNGYAESKELLLGSYKIVQESIPESYAKIDEIATVELQKRKDPNDYQIVEVDCEKTKVNVAVWDELNNENGLGQVVYKLSNDKNNKVQEFTTSQEGKFEVTNLQKDTTYYLTEVKGKENYLLNEEVYQFKVDENGKIENQGVYNLDLFNRMIRIRVAATEGIFGWNFTKLQMSIRDEKGNVIQEWIGDSKGTEIEGITPGRYLLSLEGNNSLVINSKSKWITIEDKAEVQNINYRIWTPWNILECVAIGLIIIIFVIICIKNIRGGKE